MTEYRALYREARPEVFSELLGQEPIVRILKHQIETNTVSHAYLFCGTRGTGKTTTARLLAKAVNCTGEGEKPCGVCQSCRDIAEGRFIDVVEIDAASNNGVDNIRELRQTVDYPPAVGKKKVYIIDEAHMLTAGAENALLKILEEPPENVIFILATTNPDALLQTVRSRCMRLDFRRVPAKTLEAHMRELCRRRGVNASDDALKLLAANADGSVRDGLSLLEQCLSSGGGTLDRGMVLDVLGTVSGEFFLELTDCVMRRDISRAFTLVEQATQEGKDTRQLLKDWMSHLRAVLIAKYVSDPTDMLNMSEENIARLKKQGEYIPIEDLNRAILTLARTIDEARYSTQARVLLEVAVVTIAYNIDVDRTPKKNAAGKEAAETPENAAGKEAAEAPENAAGKEAAEAPKNAAGKEAAETPENAAGKEAAEAPENAAGTETEDTAEDRPGDESGGATPALGAKERSELWNDVFEDAVQRSPKMHAMRGCELTEVGTDECRILVRGPMEKRILENERGMIEELLENRLGRHVMMVVRLEQDGGEDDDEFVRDAEKATSVLGFHVRVEK